jgi:hypothetical protein
MHARHWAALACLGTGPGHLTVYIGTYVCMLASLQDNIKCPALGIDLGYLAVQTPGKKVGTDACRTGVVG